MPHLSCITFQGHVSPQHQLSVPSIHGLIVLANVPVGTAFSNTEGWNTRSYSLPFRRYFAGEPCSLALQDGAGAMTNMLCVFVCRGHSLLELAGSGVAAAIGLEIEAYCDGCTAKHSHKWHTRLSCIASCSQLVHPWTKPSLPGHS